MHVFTQVGFGALSFPSYNDSALAKGYSWYPHLDSRGNQRTSCGGSERIGWTVRPGTRYVDNLPGCWMRNGGAWGQVRSDTGDVAAPVAVMRTTVPTTARAPAPDPTAQCLSNWNSWRTMFPTQAACAGDTAARDRYIDLCLDVRAGRLQAGSAATEWNSYVSGRCTKRPPPTRPPAPPPMQSGPDPDGGDFPDTTTPMDSPFELPGGGDPMDAGGPGGDTTESGPRAFLRQVGSVVGVGLVVAVGLTLYRKRKLLKRR